MGANGAGKSTLVKILTGAVRPDGGTIAHPRPRSAPPTRPAEARRGGLVSVYQEPALIPDLDIRSNLRLTETPLEPFRHWVARARPRRSRPLRAGARDVPLASLRIIDLARALAIEPDVLMLDEMTAALPANLTERVLEVVGRQRGGDRSVIFISHRMIEIAAVCDRATVLREGETVGVVDVTAGLRGADRRADARRESPRPRPWPSRRSRRARAAADDAAADLAPAASPRAPSSRTSRSTCTRARCSASSPSRARARTSCSTSSRAPTGRAAASSLVDGAPRLVPPSRRRDPRRPRVRRPPTAPRRC